MSEHCPGCVERDIWKDIAKSGEASALNLAAYAQDEAQYTLPMSGPHLTVRNAIKALRAEVERANVEAARRAETMIFTVIATIGGQVEGHPTHRGNFLQRVRELVRKEAALAASQQEVEWQKQNRAIEGGKSVSLRTALDASQARVGELEGVLRECLRRDTEYSPGGLILDHDAIKAMLTPTPEEKR